MLLQFCTLDWKYAYLTTGSARYIPREMKVWTPQHKKYFLRFVCCLFCIFKWLVWQNYNKCYRDTVFTSLVKDAGNVLICWENFRIDWITADSGSHSAFTKSVTGTCGYKSWRSQFSKLCARLILSYLFNKVHWGCKVFDKELHTRHTYISLLHHLGLFVIAALRGIGCSYLISSDWFKLRHILAYIQNSNLDPRIIITSWKKGQELPSGRGGSTFTDNSFPLAGVLTIPSFPEMLECNLEAGFSSKQACH